MKTILWIARVTSVIVIVPLMMILIGEHGDGRAGLRGWLYLALFPVGFSAAYLAAWRWPVVGGFASLVCMAGSLTLLNGWFGWEPYLIWAALCVPGILFLIAGMKTSRVVADRV